MSPVVVDFMPTKRDDIAGAGFLDLVAAIGVHLQDAADTLALAP